MRTTPHETIVQSAQPSTRRLVRSGALAGAIAAVCTTVVGATASAAGVSLDVNAEAIPIPAFAWWTIVGAAVGVVLARLLRERRRFVVVAMVATGLSLIPAIAAPDDTATKTVLVGTHLLAAAIIIPTLSRRLIAARTRDREAGLAASPVAAGPDLVAQSPGRPTFDRDGRETRLAAPIRLGPGQVVGQSR